MASLVLLITCSMATMPYTSKHFHTLSEVSMLRQQEREVNGGELVQETVIETAASTSDIVKIAAHSRARSVAGVIAGVLRKHDRLELQSIGAAATNQAVKAIAIANHYLQEDNIALSFVPSFLSVIVNGEERTALRFLIERRVQQETS